MASTIAAWPTVALGEVLTPISRPVLVIPTQLYPLLGMHWYAEGLYIKDRKLGAQIQADTLYEVREGDFVYNRLFAWKGSFGVADAEVDGCFVSNEFPCFQADRSRIHPAFLHYYFSQAKVWEFVESQSSGSTPTSRLRLKEPQFLALEIPLPPLDEQRRIVARIEALAARIEQARGLRREALVETYALHKSAMSQAFSMRSGTWETKIESVCEAIIDNLHSNPVYSENGVPCVRSQDVGWGVLRLEGALKTAEDEYTRRTVRGEPRPGDVVLVREGDIGRAALVAQGQRFSLGQRVMMLRPDRSQVLPEYLLYQILSPCIRDEQILPLKRGTTSSHLNITDLRRFKFLLTSLDEQRQIVSRLQETQMSIEALKKGQSESASELDALLPAILDQAFRGEL